MKTIKRILPVISAATVCVVPLLGTSVVNAASFRANGALVAPGTLFTTKLIAENGFTVNNIRTTSFDAERNLITNNPVTFDVVLVGDANNGVVTIADATAIYQYVGNPSNYGISNLRAADVNFDGTVDSEDAQLIQMYDAGMIYNF